MGYWHNMKVAIHQPTYIPYLGYFYKIAQVDIFVFLDNVPLLQGRGWGTRNRIMTPKGPQWLTIPCKKKGKREQLIRDVEIDNTTHWQRKHWETIRHNYSKAPYYEWVAGLLSDTYSTKWDRLAELNKHLIRTISRALNLRRPLIEASWVGAQGNGEGLLINICRDVGADTSLSGPGGANSQDPAHFEAAGITLEYSDFVHPVYAQQVPGFVRDVSIVDVLCNWGPTWTEEFLKAKLNGDLA